MAEVNGTFFRVYHGHSAEASFALNPDAAEFKPGQKSHSLGQIVIWKESVLRSQSADIEVACSDQCIASGLLGRKSFQFC